MGERIETQWEPNPKHGDHAGEDLPGFLFACNIITAEDNEKVAEYAIAEGCSFVIALRKLAIVEPNLLAQKISDFYKVPLLTEESLSGEHPPLDGLSKIFLRERNIVPIAKEGERIVVAIEDPSDHDAINAVRLALDGTVSIVAAPFGIIQGIIEHHGNENSVQNIWEENAPNESVHEDVDHLRDLALETPVVGFVNTLIEDAVHKRATDIHIEPFANRLSLRLRIDGVLHEYPAPPFSMGRAITSRVKIISGLDIAEHRLPQDGRSKIRIGHHNLDLRVATAPTLYGESVAIRILDNIRRSLDFSKLGYSARDEQQFRKSLSAPHGLILVTGPTGSGKTTTLATALSHLNKKHRKILSVEDPIEYEIEGINQTQIKPEIGLTFANTLRSFLRHDPDILMVGEIRDKETADIAIHAALTGHLILSTLHTNNAIGAIPRMLDMGIDPYLLASTLKCVVAQRLVRLLCNHCKIEQEDGDEHGDDEGYGRDRSIGKKTRWVGVGCSRCSGTGYFDRIVISEILSVDNTIRQLIKPDFDKSEIAMAAQEAGMITMFQDGLDKCHQGLTTEEEVRRAASDTNLT